MKIAVIGGGIGGLTAAGLLYQTGHDVQVYEKRNDLNQVGAGIGIGSNVLKALKPYKMTYAIEQEGQALNKIEIRTNLDSFLNTLKMNQDEEQNITIHSINLDYKLKEFKQTPDNIRLYFENGQEAEADLVIAADGLNSNIRKQIQPKSEPKYAGYTCFRGVVNENLNIDRTTALEYWGHKGRFGIVPLKDDELYWFCTMNAKENDLQFKSFEKPHLQAYFNQYPDEVRNVLDAQEELGILHHDMYD
ncbi:FAD-dependent monooxygenase, partial [Bacillus subtilis]|uniref:FAD-dependent monooxygenase n=1 Tax=Bacillus subtilis TaxID=1423 RepID=UPI0039807B88